MALQIVADLVAEHGRELGFIVRAKHETAPDLHHAVGRHRGVEIRRVHQVHADVRAVPFSQAAGDALHRGLERLVADAEGTAPKACHFAVHGGPKPAFVARRIRPREASRRLPGILLLRARQAGKRKARGASGAQDGAPLHRGAGNFASSASSVSSARSASRRSPLPRWMRFNQRIRPLFRSTSDAYAVCWPPPGIARPRLRIAMAAMVAWRSALAYPSRTQV